MPYRINVDVSGHSGGVTCYTAEAPEIDNHGHLFFTDEEGYHRQVSAGHAWTVTEVPTERVPGHVAEKLKTRQEDAEVLRSQ